MTRNRMNMGRRWSKGENAAAELREFFGSFIEALRGFGVLAGGVLAEGVTHA